MLRAAHQSRLADLSQRAALIRLLGMDTENSRRRARCSPSERVWSEFLVVLDKLPPDARAVLLLHDVFGAGFDEIAPLVGLNTMTCRQRLEQARACLQVHARHLEHKTP